jgi:hypothetical protein
VKQQQRTILYWSFVIDVFGPKYSKKREREAVHKVLTRKRLRELEQAALQVTKAKLPAGFTATVS